MKRVFSDYAFGSEPRKGCWWDQTCDVPRRAPVQGSHKTQVAIVGAGFTGLSAALDLAQNKIDVMVVDEHFAGWGASGRNGGFCCLGGGKLDDRSLDAKFGKQGRLEFRQSEKAAVTLVAHLIKTLKLDVDQHSQGETQLAHRAKDMEKLRDQAESIQENYGVTPRLIEKSELLEHGMAGPFHGASTIPIGFGLNPRKYLNGLAGAAQSAGAVLYEKSPILSITPTSGGYDLKSSSGTIKAEKVIIATNGYSSEDLPNWLLGRYMPSQSTVLVTRPLSNTEIAAQGWCSNQMCYDTRTLLHYFRMMPDRRFLFGARGGLLSGSQSERRARTRLINDFKTMFPAWKRAEISNVWSGMVCLARKRMPFVGQIPGYPNLFASMCYHGNGIAMGTLSGRIVSELAQERTPTIYPQAVRLPLNRFPFGRSRRIIMPPIYSWFKLADL